MSKISKWFERDRGALTVTSSIGTLFIGLVALVVSITNAVFVGRQTKINEQLFQLQIEQIQPLFEIKTDLEYNAGSSLFETEHLYVINKGTAVRSFDSKEMVICEVVRWNNSTYNSDTAYVLIDDFFCISISDNDDERVLKHSFDVGNNKKFFDLYLASLAEKANGVHFILTKSILVTIEYADLLNEKHSQYFINKKEVDRTVFNNILNSVSRGNHFSINRITFEDLKDLFH